MRKNDYAFATGQIHPFIMYNLRYPVMDAIIKINNGERELVGLHFCYPHQYLIQVPWFNL